MASAMASTFGALYADCCDGSDERAGQCKNTCAEQGATARNAMKAKLKARTLRCVTGSRLCQKAGTRSHRAPRAHFGVHT